MTERERLRQERWLLVCRLRTLGDRRREAAGVSKRKREAARRAYEADVEAANRRLAEVNERLAELDGEQGRAA